MSDQTKGDAAGTLPADAGVDAGPTGRPRLRADLLGEACTGSDECFDKQVCAIFDAVDIMTRGPLCAPPSPCSIVTCPPGQVCLLGEVEPVTVACVAQ